MSKIFLFVLCLGLLVFALPATANQWDKTTKVTFSQPVELPNIVLPPGTYVFKLFDSPSDRNVVRVFNADETHLYATILAVPNYRLKRTEKTVMPFKERAPGMPLAMHAWFYPADNFGQEFVYPKARALEIAKTTAEPVLGAEIRPNEAPEQLLEAPVLTITPENKEIGIIAEAKPFDPTWEPAVEPISAPAELPKTASPFPAIGLAGLTSLGFSALLRIIRKRVS
jgi:hypothetical protein